MPGCVTPGRAVQVFGDKTRARELAFKCNVPVVPGTEHAVSTVAEARK